jgi:hypothetical protein
MIILISILSIPQELLFMAMCNEERTYTPAYRQAGRATEDKQRATEDY